jgi:hypothetical protein
MIGRLILIFIVGLTVAQQAVSQTNYTDISRLVRNALSENELLPGSKHTVRVYGEASAPDKAIQANEAGSPDTNIQMPKADNAGTAPSLKPGGAPLAASDDVGDFRAVRDVVLEGALPAPYVIEHMSGGGFVVAGRFEDNRSAWAVGLDEAGTFRWRYLMGPPKPDVGNRFPYFTGAVALQDGGVLLCGMVDLGTKEKHDVNGLLVRLDSRGQLIKQQFIRPPQLEFEYAHSANLDRCVPWANGAALVGRLSRSDFRGWKSVSHWIIATSSDGTVLWQKLIPSETEDGGQVAQVRPMPDGGLLISDTETIRVDAQGEVQARFHVSGFFRLIQPADARSDPQLLGCYGGNNYGRLIHLTADLHIAEEQTLEFPSGYVCGPTQYVMQTYSLADGSIVLFGYHYKNRIHTPGVVKWDSRRKTLTARTYPLGNAPWFYAAVQTDRPGVYATVRVSGFPTAYAPPERSMHVTLFEVN